MAIITSLVLTLFGFGAATAAPTSPGAPLVPVQRQGDCGESVGVFSRTGQNVEEWNLRVNGVGLTDVIQANAGTMNLVIEAPDGTLFYADDIPFDEFTPPSRFVNVSGPQVRVLVNVEAAPPNGFGCNEVITYNFPG